MADRINHNTGRLPPPTEALLAKMATAGHRASVELAAVRTKVPEWKNLGFDERENWVTVARAMYAEVAVAGGAEVKRVETPEGA